jgi:hypothetical protein
MLRLRASLVLSALPMLLSCSPTKTPSAGAPPRVCEGPPARGGANASADAVGSGDNGTVSDANSVGTSDNGWVTREAPGAWGVEQVPRAQAIARVAEAPVRVLVESTFALDECRNALATHAYFEVPAAWGAKPFVAAVIVGDVLPWRRFGMRRELYVAGVRVGALRVPQVSSCSGPMPPRDAAVIALVPVRSLGEGRRILATMR